MMLLSKIRDLPADTQDVFRATIAVLALLSLALVLAHMVHDIRRHSLTRGDICTRQGLAWSLLAIAYATAEQLLDDALPPIRLELLLLATFFVFVGLVGNYVGYWLDRRSTKAGVKLSLPADLRKTTD